MRMKGSVMNRIRTFAQNVLDANAAVVASNPMGATSEDTRSEQH